MFRISQMIYQLLGSILYRTDMRKPDDAFAYMADNQESLSRKQLEYDKPEVKSFIGKVTDLFDDHGLINGHVYFSLAERNMELGTLVEVDATRKARHTGWRAKEIHLASDHWEKERKYEIPAVVTSKAKDGSGTLNIKRTFLSSHCPNYQPWQGDKVLVTIREKGSQCAIENVQPFSKVAFKGRVTYVGKPFSYIDGEIAFDTQSCLGSYQPRKGDLVEGEMVECDQGQRWKHRALHVQSSAIKNSATSKQSASSKESKYIFIEGKFHFTCQLGSKESHTISVRNGSRELQTLTSIALSDSPGSQFVISTPKLSLEGSEVPKNITCSNEHPINLYPGMTLFFTITFDARYTGADEQVMTIDFSSFTITKTVSAVTLNEETLDVSYSPQSTTNPRGGSRLQRPLTAMPTSSTTVMPGVKPQYRTRRLPKNLPQFEVPKQLREDLINNKKQICTKYPQIKKDLSRMTYVEKFSALLYLEEINAEIEIRKFDIAGAVFKRSRGFLTLEVPSLADGYMLLSSGDRLDVSVNGDCQSIQYEGYIHDVMKEIIFVKFHSSFHDSYNEEECYVVFHINRTPFRRMHQAIRLAVQMEWPGLFPEVISTNKPLILSDTLTLTDDTHFFNKSLNNEQRLAVLRVLQAKSRPFPYVIFGPPGTGKTVTLVECVLQIFTRIRGSRVLVCTPSNSAADLITALLIGTRQWAEYEIVRLNSYRRLEENLPESISQYCQDGTNLSVVINHRIIITTCITAGMMSALDLAPKHFSHVLVDESGQASEPECMVPITLIAANPEASIVLAGDHQQLGPVIKSSISLESGLSVSFLDRVMAHKSYAKYPTGTFDEFSQYDPNMVTKLKKNYRAHPFILSLYSQLFYDNELEVCCGDKAYQLEMISELPAPRRPIVFHGLQGEMLREGGNPSWFNAVEVVQVVKYLSTALTYCKADEIGVITPYRKQVEKILQMMKSIGIFGEIKVGSVEEFQGQERKIIILSTVRSAEAISNTTANVATSLGFLGNSKRFNVAISRARCLLVVCGNPHVLVQDQWWKQLLDYCLENGCYRGVPFGS